MSDAPYRVSGEALGYRGWKLEGHELRPWTMSAHPWEPGVNRARCHIVEFDRQFPGFPEEGPTPCTDPPSPSCSCGFYAYHDADHLWRQASREGFVVGAIAAWGRLQVHRDGFRAEYARPLILAYSEGWTYRSVMRAKALASELGLPCVEAQQLKDRAEQLAQPLPEDARIGQSAPGSSSHLHFTITARRARHQHQLLAAQMQHLAAALSSAPLWTPTPPPKVRRWQTVAIAVNAIAVLANLYVFVLLTHRWYNAVSGLVSLIVTLYLWRKRRPRYLGFG